MSSAEDDAWLIVHVPGRPPISPDQQLTGLQICCIVKGRVGRTVQAMAHLIPSSKPSISFKYSHVLRSTHCHHVLGHFCWFRVFASAVQMSLMLTLSQLKEQVKSSIISGITGFSDEDSQSVVSFMKSHGNMVVNAAAIVDPLSNLVIARACDEVCSWQTAKTEVGAECSSSTKSCVEMTGWIKHESCLQRYSSGGAEQVETSIFCLRPRRWVFEQTGRSSSFWHLLRHAVMVAIESSAARDRRLFPDVRYKDGATVEEYILSPAKSQTKRRRTDGNDVSFSSTCEGNPGKTF